MHAMVRHCFSRSRRHCATMLHVRKPSMLSSLCEQVYRATWLSVRPAVQAVHAIASMSPTRPGSPDHAPLYDIWEVVSEWQEDCLMRTALVCCRNDLVARRCCFKAVSSTGMPNQRDHHVFTQILHRICTMRPCWSTSTRA